MEIQKNTDDLMDLIPAKITITEEQYEWLIKVLNGKIQPNEKLQRAVIKYNSVIQDKGN